MRPAQCMNEKCRETFYPYWLADGTEVECPDCHGTFRAKHRCNNVCRSLRFGEVEA